MDRPTLRQLEYAVAVADTGHFGRAAERCQVSQPGLSDQIRALEARLGIELFERTPRGARLTAAGDRLVDRARSLLRDCDDLVVLAGLHGSSPQGRVRLGVIPTLAPYLAAWALGHLRAEWPDVALQLGEHRTAPLVDQLARGDIDLGLLAVPFDTGNLEGEVLGHEDFVLAVPKGHPLDRPEPAALSDLRAVPLLLLEDGHCLRDHALAVCELAGAVDHTEVRSASLTTVAQMVAAGMGATLLPECALPLECREGSGLVARPIAGSVPGRDVTLMWRPTDPRARFYRGLAGRLAKAGLLKGPENRHVIVGPPA